MSWHKRIIKRELRWEVGYRERVREVVFVGEEYSREAGRLFFHSGLLGPVAGALVFFFLSL